MTLGEKIRQARLEAGLSQRQLCGGEVTRNMLSQIEMELQSLLWRPLPILRPVWEKR